MHVAKQPRTWFVQRTIKRPEIFGKALHCWQADAIFGTLTKRRSAMKRNTHWRSELVARRWIKNGYAVEKTRFAVFAIMIDN